jgi:hypothetical protein
MATALATDLRAGRKTKRLEAAIEEGLHAEIETLAKELAGGGDAKTFRSEAARVLLAEAITARRKARARSQA